MDHSDKFHHLCFPFAHPYSEISVQMLLLIVNVNPQDRLSTPSSVRGRQGGDEDKKKTL